MFFLSYASYGESINFPKIVLQRMKRIVQLFIVLDNNNNNNYNKNSLQKWVPLVNCLEKKKKKKKRKEKK